MRRIYKKLNILMVFIALLFVQGRALAEVDTSAESNGFFSLATVVDNFLNNTNEAVVVENVDNKDVQKKEFLDATQKFNQGNVSVAYSDYAKLISKMDNDVALFVFAKSLYEIGLFSLANDALSKISDRQIFVKQVANLKKSYDTTYKMEKTEEIYLAKAYSSIYFDNSAEETSFDLNKKEELIAKSDYANFVLAQALCESRQYQQALMFVDKAILKNPTNSNYLNYKLKILLQAKKYQDAQKFVERTEKLAVLTPEFKNKFNIQKQTLLANLAKNENDKKFYLTYVTFLSGNYYKTINEAQNVLTFNKTNYKLMTLQGNAYLNSHNIAEAKKNFVTSYDINKTYAPTLVGLGDIEFINGQYDNALKYYTKAQGIDKEDTTTLFKIALVYKMSPVGNEKKLAKLEKQIELTVKDPYTEYYTIATGILRTNNKAKREYLVKSLAINFLYKNAWAEYLSYQTEKKNIDPAQNFLYMISFVNKYDYNYYYYSGVVNLANEQNEKAAVDFKCCLSLNAEYEPANIRLAEIASNSGL